MSIDRHELFTRLEPPRGGAERFAARLLHESEATTAMPRTPRRLLLPAFGTAVCAALVATAAWLARPVVHAPPIARSARHGEVYNAPQFDRLLGRPARGSEFIVQIDDEAVSVTEIRTENHKVRIYQID
jgi:hypothetical protein